MIAQGKGVLLLCQHRQVFPHINQSSAGSRPRARAPSALPAARHDTERAELVAEDASHELRPVQWFPGHIAKAERQLRKELGRVDIIIEVRDARIPMSTCHPAVPVWAGSKPRVLVLNRADMVSEADRAAWSAYFAQRDQHVLWTNAMLGTGTNKVTRAAAEVGKQLNAARAHRGLQPRAVRAVIIGFPNIGKSALVNRLAGRRVASSAAKPGVTRHLTWLRLHGDIDLLDTPGVLPMSITDQKAAQRLAMCNDIGEAAYVDSLVAAALFRTLRSLPDGASVCARLEERYHVPTKDVTGEDFVVLLGEALFHGDVERAGQRMLKDFRTGALGFVALDQVDEEPQAFPSGVHGRLSGWKEESGRPDG